jgi:hypothetical protein
MSAIGLSAASRGKGFAISAYADIRHEQMFFERQQSLTLRGMEWEDRIKPMTSWSGLLLRGVGVVVLASVILAVLI